jgi:hypothetical protein
MPRLRLSPKDKEVIWSFFLKGNKTSKKLTTDGRSLDGQWLGGNNIAQWAGETIVLKDLGSIAAQVVENYVRKNCPDGIEIKEDD